MVHFFVTNGRRFCIMFRSKLHFFFLVNDTPSRSKQFNNLDPTSQSSNLPRERQVWLNVLALSRQAFGVDQTLGPWDGENVLTADGCVGIGTISWTNLCLSIR